PAGDAALTRVPAGLPLGDGPDIRPVRLADTRNLHRHHHLRQARLRDDANKSRTQNLRIILDGQQRITSIYRALTGADTVFIVRGDVLEAEGVIERPRGRCRGGGTGEEREDAVSVRLSEAYRAEAEGLEDEALGRLFAGSAFGLRLGEDDPGWKPFTKAYRR